MMLLKLKYFLLRQGLKYADTFYRKIRIFSCRHATLQEALSVRRTVGPSVGPLVRPSAQVEKWENERFGSILSMCLCWEGG